jgi:DNA-binding IclR family transcriptional regulator
MTDLAPGIADRILRHLRRPPADWHTACELSRVLGLPRAVVALSLRRLAAMGAIERGLAYDDLDLFERWRAS